MPSDDEKTRQISAQQRTRVFVMIPQGRHLKLRCPSIIFSLW
jgi:hypothetical protein